MSGSSERSRIDLMVERLAEIARDRNVNEIPLSGGNDELDGLALAINMLVDDLRYVESEREASESQLRLAEERFRIIIENSQAIIFIINTEGVFELSEGVALASLGLEPGQVVGQNAYEIYAKFPRIIEGIDSALAGQKITDEIDVGGVFFDIFFSPFRDTDGEVLGLLGMATDITERKRAEESLRDSKALLVRSQEIAHVGSWELDLIADRLTWSNEVYRIFGLEPQEIPATYEAFLEAIHPEDRAAVDAAYTQSVREGEDSYEIEHRVIREQIGEVRYVHEKCVHVRDGKGRVVRSIGIVQDITDQKLAEKALRESEAHFRLLTENALDFVWKIDMDMNVLYASPSVLEQTGYSTDEFMKMNLREMYTPEESQRILKITGEELAKGAPHHGITFQAFHLHKEGHAFPVEIGARIIYDDNGRPEHIQGFTRDITERRQAEEEREKLHSQLNQAQKMESVGRLAGGVAHDFNNMLSVILGHTDLALSQLDPSEPLYADLREIQKAAKRSADLTRQLLAFARQQTVVPRVLDLNDTAGGMLNLLLRLIGEDIDLGPVNTKDKSVYWGYGNH